MRKLASIRKIEEIAEIKLIETNEPADSITMYRVDGWWVVGKRGEYNIGDLVIYVEIDSILPNDNPAFKFMEPRKYRVKTMKLSKFYYGEDKDNVVISQGILFSTNILDEKVKLELGKDLTDILRITKIEDETREQRPMKRIDRSPAFYQKHAKFFKTRFGRWLKRRKLFRLLVKHFLVKTVNSKKYPNYIVKTDEDRIQNRLWVFEEYKDVPLQVTEKLDGTSTTFGIELKGKKFDFAVCSRNVRQLSRKQVTYFKDAGVNYYWEMEEKYNIENLLKHLFKKLKAKETLYLQGETIGPSIQSNRYKLKEREFHAFNLVVDGVKLNTVEAAKLIEEAQKELNNKNHFSWVPILDTNFYLPKTLDELVKLSTAKSTLAEVLREGLVIRDAKNTVSFKVISPEWLLQNKL